VEEAESRLDIASLIGHGFEKTEVEEFRFPN